MTVGRSPADEQRAQTVIALTREGVEAKAIAAQLGITPRSVWRIRQNRGVSGPRPKPYSADELARAKQLLDEGAPYPQVCVAIGRSKDSAGTLAKHLPGYTWNKQQCGELAAMIRKLNRL